MSNDAELRRDVMGELAWDPAVRATDVGVTVRDGIVSEITLLSKSQAADLEHRIGETLTRQALDDAGQIRVAVRGDAVNPSGTVQSRRERDVAAAVAWAAPGVHAVVDERHVA